MIGQIMLFVRRPPRSPKQCSTLLAGLTPLGLQYVSIVRVQSAGRSDQILLRYSLTDMKEKLPSAGERRMSEGRGFLIAVHRAGQCCFKGGVLTG
jgi:hypothetical protein